MEDNYLIIVWFSHITMNQPQVYVTLLPLEPPFLLHLPTLLGFHRAPGLGPLHHMANSHWLTILHMLRCMLQCSSLKSSHPFHPPLCPQVCLSVCVSHLVVSDSLWSHGLGPARILCPWNSSGKSTGVCCHSLLQGIFLTQGSNLGFLHCRQIIHHKSVEESSKIYQGALVRVTQSCVTLCDPMNYTVYRIFHSRILE